MKKILLAAVMLSYSFSDDLLISTKENFSKLIQQVKVKQNSKPKIKEISYNPFLFDVMKKDVELAVSGKEIIKYSLSAILNNKVLINEKWYKVNENVGEARVIEIKNKSVVLQNITSNDKITIEIGLSNSFEKSENITDNTNEEELIQELLQLNLLDKKNKNVENKTIQDNKISTEIILPEVLESNVTENKKEKDSFKALREIKFNDVDKSDRTIINIKNVIEEPIYNTEDLSGEIEDSSLNLDGISNFYSIALLSSSDLLFAKSKLNKNNLLIEDNRTKYKYRLIQGKYKTFKDALIDLEKIKVEYNTFNPYITRINNLSSYKIIEGK